MYSISLFPSREVFMALALSLFDQPQKGLAQLTQLLRRSRAPPISAIYTVQLLKPKPPSCYGLDLIRFISQLADLSQGSSVSESVSILSEGSLLSEMRHSLTHRYMPSDELIMLARKLALRDLREKYWKAVYDQMVEEAVYSVEGLEREHVRIFGTGLDLGVGAQAAEINVDALVRMKNYQFKRKVGAYIDRVNSKEEVIQAMGKLTELKRAVMFSQMLAKYCQGFKEERLYQLICSVLKPNLLLKEQTLNQGYIMKKLKRIRFAEFIGFNSQLLDNLPEKIRQQVQKPFRRAQQQHFQLYNPNPSQPPEPPT